MAKLNYDFFDKNELQYSDGDIENEIYEIVKNNVDYEKILSEDDRWPLFYHLSKFRTNIVKWYTFEKNAQILEVGAGCGAITSELCMNAAKVTSVELSEIRSLINFERNKNYENLEIYVGNFDGIEFMEKFDYIILNGVFEYANLYYKSPEPHVDFLKKLKNLLKSNGKIIITIENRIGLKYITGACEDHTNTIYSGINGYNNNEKVRTFSKSELTDLVESIDLQILKFYYPYPDYKFVDSIYTDESYELIPLIYNLNPYDFDRIQLFDELLLNQTLTNEKIAGNFSNSFFVEIGDKSTENSKNLIYSKISSNRKKSFEIVTSIYKENEEILVKKIGTNEESKMHILNMQKTFENIPTSNRYKYLQMQEMENSVFYSFKNGITLEQYLENKLENNNFNDFINIVNRYFDTLMENSYEKYNFYNEEFKKIFGYEQLDMTLQCTSMGNIDLMFNNIIVEEEQWIVMDYEWVFDFDIPVQFIMWRTIDEFYNRSEYIREYTSLKGILGLFGITEIMSETFRKWAIHFIVDYVGIFNKERYYKNTVFLDINEELQKKLTLNKKSCKIYVDIGNGFNEDDIVSRDYFISQKCVKVHFDLSNFEDIQKLRFDPLENEACQVKIEKIFVNNDEYPDINIIVNQNYENFNGYHQIFDGDPAFIFENLDNRCTSITIWFHINTFSENELMNYALFSLNSSYEQILMVKEISAKVEKDLEYKNANLENKYHDLEYKNANLENKYHDLEYKNANLEQKHHDSEYKNANLEQKHHDLECKNANLEQKYNDLDIANEQLQQEIFKLNESLNRELEAKNYLESEINAMHNSKTFRYSAKVRKLWCK